MAGRYKPYAEYKDSGITWMELVPDHWEVVRFKNALFEKRKVSNSALEAGSISFGKVVYKNGESLSPETKESYQEVLEGEFLINPLNLNFDLLSLRTALSSINVVVSTGYIVLRSHAKYVKRYMRWLLQQFDVSHMKTLGAGVRQTINYSDIANSYFCEPSAEEQLAIANFLDHETAKIDTLIEKQQQLIQLLKEKRQAVISHAVTKGLNPNAKMKDSGVEWLGEVPEGWEVHSVKYLADFVGTGGTPKEESSFTDEEEIHWFTPGDFNENGILTSSSKHVTNVACVKGDAKIYKRPSVLVIGIGATLGRVGYCKKIFSCNQQINVVTPNHRIDGLFMMHALSVQSEQMRLNSNSSTIGIMNQEKTKLIKLAVPPVV